MYSVTSLPSIGKSSLIVNQFSLKQHSSSSAVSDCWKNLKNKISAIWQKVLSCLLSLFSCKKKEAVNKTVAKPLTSTPTLPVIPRPVKPNVNRITKPTAEVKPEKPNNLKPTPEKPNTVKGPSLDTVPAPVKNTILSFLDPRSILAFERTSSENRNFVNQSSSLWRKLIKDVKPSYVEVDYSKKNFQEVAKKIAYVGMHRLSSIREYVPVPYYQGITTMGDIKRRISSATGIPLNEMGIYHIGFLGKKRETAIPDGSDGFQMFMPGFHNQNPEDDTVLCSNALRYYGTLVDPDTYSEDIRDQIHLSFTFDRKSSVLDID